MNCISCTSLLRYKYGEWTTVILAFPRLTVELCELFFFETLQLCFHKVILKYTYVLVILKKKIYQLAIYDPRPLYKKFQVLFSVETIGHCMIQLSAVGYIKGKREVVKHLWIM